MGVVCDMGTPPAMVPGGSFFWSDERAPVQGSRVYGCYKGDPSRVCAWSARILAWNPQWSGVASAFAFFGSQRGEQGQHFLWFHSCHSCHSCHSWRVASFPRIWTKTIASRWTGVRCWDQNLPFEALKSKLYGRFPQQKLGVQQNHGFSNQKWAIAGILLLFLGYPHWNRSPQMIWTHLEMTMICVFFPRRISLVVTHHLELLSDLGIRSMAKARCSSSKSNGYSMLFRYRNHTVRIIRIHALPDFGQ